MENDNNTDDQFRMFIERITDGFIALDKSFCYTYANAKVGQLVQRDPASLIGKNVWEEFPDAVGSSTYKAFHTAMNEQRFLSIIDYYPPLDLWQENYIYPSTDGLSVFIKDISDRKKLEKELYEQERNQQFEIMITALEAQEKERTLIGQELHDNVNQLLVATKLVLHLMKDDPAKVSPLMFSKCIDNIEKAIEENRRLSHELVTPDLKEQSLIEQFQHLFQGMLGTNGIEFKIQASGFKENLLDKQKQLALYRIAQEQCTNIVKHSKAKKVLLDLKCNENVCTMIIKDDGVGKEFAKTGTGIGLKNMEGRVKFFGGNLIVKTGPDKGFNLEVTMPVNGMITI